MDFAKAFSYVFEDPDWIKKVVIMALVSLIPFVGWFVLLGWALEVTRNVIQRDPSPLPELKFGEQLGHGFRGFLVALVYAIPVVLLQLPISIGSSMIQTNGSSSDMTNTIILIISVCCGSLIFIYSILMAFVIPAAFGNFVAQNRVGAAYNLKQVFALVRANPGAYLLTLLGVFLAGAIGSAGSIACGVGILFTMAYSMAIQGHLYGQAYLAAVRNQAYSQ